MEFSKKEYNKRVIRRFFLHPATILPIVAGATLLMVGWALEVPKLLFAGFASAILGTGGTLTTRLFLGVEKHAKDVMEEMQREIEEERKERLDELDSNLSRDRDKRTHVLLRDLRAITENFTTRREEWTEVLGSSGKYFDVTNKIEKLFDASVKSLEETLVLRERIRKISSSTAKKPFRERRERLIEEVSGSVEKIGETINRLEMMEAKGIGKHGKSEVEKLTSDLDTSLAIAQRVEERLSGETDYSEFLEAAEQS